MHLEATLTFNKVVADPIFFKSTPPSLPKTLDFLTKLKSTSAENIIRELACKYIEGNEFKGLRSFKSLFFLFSI